MACLPSAALGVNRILRMRGELKTAQMIHLMQYADYSFT